MNEFFSISSQHETAEIVIEDCARQLKAAPAEANFGFIYVTDAMTADFPKLLTECKSVTGINNWIGTIGLGVIAKQKEMYDAPAASIMLANFNPDDYTMVPSIRKIDEIAPSLNWPRMFVTNFGIIHGDPFNPHTQYLIEDIQQHVANGFITGGLTFSRSQQYQVSNYVVSGGVSGALFSENINVITNLTQGCSPVGSKHTITQSMQNTALTVDHKPALNVLIKAMDISDFKTLKQSMGEVFIGLCLMVNDKSDYTVRSLIGIDPDKNLFAINDYLIEGTEIVFCRRNAQTAVEDMQHMLNNIAARLKQKIKGGVYISCVGRGRDEFGQNSEEVKMIHATLGDFPLTGFFANGEIHHNRLYGYTGVLTLFTE
ncbi:MAG: FIST C-terminal domain-containing protein [Gammaproteobacteria bacterium]|nr:FIST C-terminal domain-containing protein [Gammaproteobacteria bacterium]